MPKGTFTANRAEGYKLVMSGVTGLTWLEVG